MNAKKSIIIFESIMFVLVVVSLFSAFSDNEMVESLDWYIWFIFVVDYTVRLFLSENRWAHIKKHPLELIAIIPLDAIFRAARVVRLLRILRLIGIGARYMSPVYRLLRTNGLDKVLMVALVLLFIVPIPIVYLEPSIDTFVDALWWAVVTTTTVGYGDLSPETPVGRMLAVILMLVGIGIIGTLTSAITSFFNRDGAKNHEKRVLEILASIEEVESLTENDVELINRYMERKKK